MRSDSDEMCVAFADRNGNVYDYPGREPAFRTGRSPVRVDPDELIPLPFGSYLFSLPGRKPVCYNTGSGEFRPVSRSPVRGSTLAASSFLASGYLRTYLPAFVTEPGAPRLTQWAYAGLVIRDGEFLVPAVRIDNDPRSDPEIHMNDKELMARIREVVAEYPENRLIRQLVHCSTESNCLCARNFFLGRYEAPLPTTPICNAGCIGCLSYQQDGTASQERLTFSPDPAEITEVMLHHILAVDRSVVSFGQGCEGEPLLRWKDLSVAVAELRQRTDRGTLHINTNASLPEGVLSLIDSGLDSIRVSMNSPTQEYYCRYHRPKSYEFKDVLRSIDTALDAGIFVSLNLFFMPGFTDMESEVESLMNFLERHPVNMIQTRNLNIDPDYYFDSIGFVETEPLGIRNLIAMIKRTYPDMMIGYYNPPREQFNTTGRGGRSGNAGLETSETGREKECYEQKNI